MCADGTVATDRLGIENKWLKKIKTKNEAAVTARPSGNGSRLNEHHDRNRVLVLKGRDEGVDPREETCDRVSLWTMSFGA